MTTTHSSRLTHSGSDQAFLILIAAVVTIGGGVWATGQTAGLLFGHTWITVGISNIVDILLRLPGTIGDPARAWPEETHSDLPGLPGFLFSAVLVSGAATGLAIGLRRLLPTGSSRAGWASRVDLNKSLSPAAALKQASKLRPTLEGKATLDHVAVDLGRVEGSYRKAVASIESSVLIFAAARSGKTSQVLIPWLTHWKGPALVTSVRTDVILNTLLLRNTGGRPAAVMDVSGTEWLYQLCWNLVIGCEDYDKARRRAGVLITVGGNREGGDSSNTAFYRSNAINLMAGWLHAAALDGRNLTDICDWALDETNRAAIAILQEHPNATAGVSANLLTLYDAYPETRTNLWATVQPTVAPILSERVKKIFCPIPAEHIDIAKFLDDEGTFYLRVPENLASEMAPLITAFVDEVKETALAKADAHPSGRLDPPLGCHFDEVGNISPLPDLPALMSYAAGSGIFITGILHDIAQARHVWGHNGADMLWGASTVKVALGGLSGDEAKSFSDLAGTWWDSTTTYQHGPQGTTQSISDRERPTITQGQVRTLSVNDRKALIIHSSTPAVLTRMKRHYESKDAKLYENARTELSRRLDGHRHSSIYEETQQPDAKNRGGITW